MRDLLWQLLVQPDATTVRVPVLPGRDRDVALGRLRDLPRGAPVALLDSAPLSNGRCSRFAREAGVNIERQYLVLPTLSSATYIVEDASESVRYFREANLTPPPANAVLSSLASATLWLARHLLPWRLLGALTVGRVALGCRL